MSKIFKVLGTVTSLAIAFIISFCLIAIVSFCSCWLQVRFESYGMVMRVWCVVAIISLAVCFYRLINPSKYYSTDDDE